MKELLKKLLLVQEELKPVVKDGVNPHFHNRYATLGALLDEVKPLLTKHGLFLTQPIQDGTIKTIIFHVESGESLQSSFQLPDLQDMQKLGSAITYAKRYMLDSILALENDDDDGNLASTPKAAPRPVQSATGGTHTCTDCNKPFTPKPGTESYAKTCYPCYKAKADKPLPKFDAKESAQEDYSDMGFEIPFN